MRRPRAGARRLLALGFAGALAFGGLVAGVSAAQAAEGDPTGGIDIAVTTTSTPGAPTPTPTPSSTPIQGSPSGSAPVSGAGSGSTGYSGGSGSGTGSAAVTTPQDPGTVQPAIDTASADTFDLGGVIYMSGVRTGFTPSINPFGGRMDVAFTVKNVSQSTFDSKAEFWMTNTFGAGIGESTTVDVPALKPGESRVVSATLSGVGQWMLVTSHATFIPPSTVDGTDVPSVTRDAITVAFPWLTATGVVIAGAAVAVWLLLRRAAMPVLAAGTA